jgi:hypothetical protein
VLAQDKYERRREDQQQDDPDDNARESMLVLSGSR